MARRRRCSALTPLMVKLSPILPGIVGFASEGGRRRLPRPSPNSPPKEAAARRARTTTLRGRDGSGGRSPRVRALAHGDEGGDTEPTRGIGGPLPAGPRGSNPGRVMRNEAPRPAPLRSDTEPRWASTMAFTMARPNPVPPFDLILESSVLANRFKHGPADREGSRAPCRRSRSQLGHLP